MEDSVDLRIDADRDADQRSFIDRWKSNGWKGSISAVTGYGKTRIGLLAAAEVNREVPGKAIEVVVPTLVLKAQWEAHIHQYGLHNVEVFVINTYIQQKHQPFLLILDEIHRYGSEQFSKVFIQASYRAILGLTASFERQDGKHLLIAAYAPIIKTVKLNEALTKGYVSDFRVFNLSIQLPAEQQLKYDEIERRYNYYFDLFDRDFNSARSAMLNSRYRNQLAQQKGRSTYMLLTEAGNYFYYLRERKQFLNANAVKLNMVEQLFKTFNRKMVVFSESNAFADAVAERIGDKAFAFHSGTASKKRRNEQLESFKNNKQYSLISAVKALEEGLDIPDLEMAIIVSGNATIRQYIQRIGRSLRTQPGKTAIIINLYIHGTQDEQWLRRRQFNNDTNTCWVENVESIERRLSQAADGSTVPVESDHVGDKSG
jgi:superfamily II DNA or RNA helicase